MGRNATLPFGEVPGVKVPRSKINKPHTLKTTFNAGLLVPVYCNQVLPGQTVEMDVNSFIRMSTSVTPVMDDLIADLYFFFVPTRFLWSNWERFLGANDTGSWAQTTTYVPPKLGTTGNLHVYDQDDLAAYLGVYPQNIALPNISSQADVSPTSLPLVAYMKIWNDWFRNENLEKEIPLPTGNIGVYGSKTNSFYTDIVQGYGLAPVNKTADIFTRSLPAPQKGDSVRIPVNQGTSVKPLAFINGGTGVVTDLSLGISSGTAPANILSTTSTGSSSGAVVLSGSALGTINDLRNAFAIQRMLEKDARGGTRYIELLKSHFGVSNGDLTLGRSEYLGGKRFGINMNQVVQTSGLDSNTTTPTPLGSTAGVSVTGDKSSLFTKSFTEHGWLIGVVTVRIKHHTYSQGINRQYFMNTRYDLYWPSLANLGEMAVYKKEIYAGSSTTPNINKDVFGYQEAWYFYRYYPNSLTGYFATQNATPLSAWHYGDLYPSAPSLTSTFSHEERYQIDRTLAIPSTSGQHQFLADFFFNEKDVLPMPLYSIPGLVDHY